MTHYDTLLSFSQDEITYWKAKNIDKCQYTNFARSYSARDNEYVLFELKDGRITIYSEKPTTKRARTYGNLLKIVYKHFLSPNTEIVVPCLLGDLAKGCDDIPLLSFQKHKSDNIVLLPDFECLFHFYERREWRDPYSYSEKHHRAIFSGATTGTLNSITSIERNDRIRLAKFFDGNPAVTFKLPVVCQCDGKETEEFLRSFPFCQGPLIPMREQFRYRFIISVDGNGATCSRVSLVLKSNSVLLKYKSDYIAWFHKQLVPWVHYVPINKEDDIMECLEQSKIDGTPFSVISKNSRDFYYAFQTRDDILRYTAVIINELYGLFGQNEIYLRNKAQIETRNGSVTRFECAFQNLQRRIFGK
jgi:hypothetical protein